jgi:small-conductance mechanosensitive channel
MNIVSIANREIDEVEVVSGYLYITVPLPYGLKIAKAEPVLNEIVTTLQKGNNVTSAAYQGLTDIANSSLNYQIVVTCDPMNQLQVRRDCLGTIVRTLEEHKISIPYNQLDIHQK